jgi:UDP-2,4-diacetamido-2,4,6-trideoxy-beta-L-altropyranose hydrolase
MKVAIRADGSSFIGMGHVMRMLALAQALQRIGHEVIFLSRFEPGMSRIRQQGFAVREVVGGLSDGANKDYEPAADTDAVCRILATEQFDCLVTDSYRVDAAFFQQVRPFVAASFYVDDLNRFPVAVDAVVNGNINAVELGYDNWPAASQCWLGCRYNLLRQEFAEIPERLTAVTVSNLLIVAGGGDAGQLLVFLIHSLLELAVAKQISLQIVAPTHSVADQELTALVGSYSEHVKLHRGVTEMAQLMRQCDLAISAGGSTLYELCATGVPRLAIVLADNQRGVVSAMERQELVLPLGTVAELQPDLVVEQVSCLVNDWQRRDRMNQLGRKLVDGQGALRVAHKIAEVVAAAKGGQQGEQT